MDELKFKQYLKEVSDGDAYDVKEVARRLNLSVWSVRIFVREGKIDAMKVGRGYLIPKTALYAYIRERVKPNFDPADVFSPEEKIVPSTLDEDQQALYAEHLANVSKPDPEPEPEPTEDEIEAERFEQYRPRPTSFSDGFFG